MFVNLVLSCTYGTIIIIITQKNLPPTLPVRCAFGFEKQSAAPNEVIGVIGTVGVMLGNCIVFVAGVWYLHFRRQRWTKVVQIVGLLFTILAAVGVTVRIILLSQAFGKPNVLLKDQQEKDWSYGQLLPMLLLLLPGLSAIEIMRGKSYLCTYLQS